MYSRKKPIINVYVIINFVQSFGVTGVLGGKNYFL